MGRLRRGVLVWLLAASSQMLSAPFAVAQFGSGLEPPSSAPGLSEAMSSDPASCAATPLSTPPPPMKALDRDAAVRLQVVVGRDGRIMDGHVLEGGGSGDPARDAAMLAHVMQNWRYQPRGEHCQAVTLRIAAHFPHVTCAPEPMRETWTEPDVDLPDRPRAVELRVGVGPDGTVQTAEVTSSSGVAALDAAALAHVKAAWRWQPFACNTAPLVMGSVRIDFSYVPPDPP
jgi:TonB family protein